MLKQTFNHRRSGARFESIFRPPTGRLTHLPQNGITVPLDDRLYGPTKSFPGRRSSREIKLNFKICYIMIKGIQTVTRMTLVQHKGHPCDRKKDKKIILDNEKNYN